MSRSLRWLIALLVLLGLIWTGVWFGARAWVVPKLDAVIEREALRGRKIICEDRSIDGFPFSVRFTCARGSVEIARPDGGKIDISFGTLVIRAGLEQPTQVVATLAAPIVVRTPNQPTITVVWREATARARLSTIGPDALSVTLKEPKLGTDPGATPLDGARASEIRLSGSLRAGGDGVLDTTLFASGVSAPLADRLLKSDEAMNLDLAITFTATGGLRRLPPPVALETWRRNGGKAQITQLAFSRGRSELTATGELGLDEQHMLAGRIAGQARGFTDLLAAQQNRVGSITSRLPGVVNARLPFAVNFGEGRIRLGGVAIGTLSPLY